MSKQPSLIEFGKQFSTEKKCIAHLEAIRWPAGLRCLKCQGERISRIEATGKTGKLRHLYLCLDCQYQYSVTVGTVFHNSHVPLTKWFIAIYLMCTAKKGVSAKQLERQLGVSYETAWSMAHRIRLAMQEDWKLLARLSGVVEVDETYVGGKNHNKHKDKRKGGRGGPGSGKFIVIGAVQRGGGVIAKVIDKANTAEMDSFVNDAVDTSVSLLATDEHSGYRFLKRRYPHKVIRHSSGQYVMGAIHTNTIEGFWSIFKRGIFGTFHKVSKKYLPLYVAEFQFRHNMRQEQGGMFNMVLRTSF